MCFVTFWWLTYTYYIYPYIITFYHDISSENTISNYCDMYYLCILMYSVLQTLILLHIPNIFVTFEWEKYIDAYFNTWILHLDVLIAQVTWRPLRMAESSCIFNHVSRIYRIAMSIMYILRRKGGDILSSYEKSLTRFGSLQRQGSPERLPTPTPWGGSTEYTPSGCGGRRMERVRCLAYWILILILILYWS